MSGPRVVLEGQVELDRAKALPMVCDDCGERVLLLMPMSLSTLAAFMRAFEDHHAECCSRQAGEAS